MSVASGAGSAVAMGVGGIVAVLLISAVFYVIGRGEDRDRATPGVAKNAPAAGGLTAEDASAAPDSAPAPRAGARSRRPAASTTRRRRP